MPTREIRVGLTPVTTVHGTLLSQLSLVFDSHPQSLPRITQIPSSSGAEPADVWLVRCRRRLPHSYLDVPSEWSGPYCQPQSLPYISALFLPVSPIYMTIGSF